MTAPSTPGDQLLILFGATGDLARRKLLPGLFHLAVAGMMPAHYPIVGSGRPEGAPDADGFRSHVRAALAEFARRELSDESWQSFARSFSFAAASTEQPQALLDAVAQAEHELGGDVQRLIYLAVPPHAFALMVELLGACGLADRARLIIEKPFGHDLASARTLNKILYRAFDEEQLFRIDHFLGEEAVQNILAFRFANGLFEPVWNQRHVSYVQIDVPEQLTIEGRAGFFEQTGTFRDMVVTHLLHLLGFVAMEPPGHLDARTLRDATARVFEAIRPIDPARVVFGQYDGYRAEPGVVTSSNVETFAALEVHVDNERWAGVPFQLRTGNALAKSRHTVTLGFKEPVRTMFELAETATPTAHPNELSFRYADSFDVANELEAYERLIHDCMLGDHTLFTRADGIERLWEISAPLLEQPPKPRPYPQGSWGPEAIEQLVAPHHWHLPYPARS